MKENDRGKLAVAPPKRKDDSPSISRETARSFFVASWLCGLVSLVCQAKLGQSSTDALNYW